MERVENGPAASERDYDRVTQASLNGIYVKAAEMDRGHNEAPAPHMRPPGEVCDAQTHASGGGFSDAESHASDRGWADADTHASTHASDGR